MTLHTLFPRTLTAAFALSTLFTAAATAQSETRPRHATTTTTIDARGMTRLDTDPVVISTAEPDERPALSVPPPAGPLLPPRALHINQMIMAAIDARMGTPYRLGAVGPSRFDCSGFVWSVFQSAGISFERSNARTLWSRLAPAREEEKFQFGTLVFFNNLRHVGIVADEHGFYHASTTHGVTYSPFGDYWSARIDGFRLAPTAPEFTASARTTRAAAMMIE